ncbi:hypothetical protein DCAR_0415730 [Daucus carota subsp. sativus]|uniref:Uncharacterized protein n=1 Tax=Daucus carota subsp. sativus TaxID=79200 RepID=A0AAF0WUM7_DAUCS|nr:PREDICTED: uncharacterized protein LOC108219264 [Daucus carota subsp. sativus]WOG96395.1 hypothetical protein DCAR_0415730 [Daucus carota subsp. sativus]
MEQISCSYDRTNMKTAGNPSSGPASQREGESILLQLLKLARIKDLIRVYCLEGYPKWKYMLRKFILLRKYEKNPKGRRRNGKIQRVSALPTLRISCRLVR